METQNIELVQPREPPFRLFRSNQQREDGLSSTTQIAKASEHLVCCELILQGHNAYLTDAGQPYDVIVDTGVGQFIRVQVKTTTRMYGRPGYPPVYRFPFRKSRTGDRRITAKDVDVFALVALDARQIAWVPVRSVLNGSGYAKTTVELKTRRLFYQRGRKGVDPNRAGRFMEDFADFARAARKEEQTLWSTHP